MGHTKLLQRLQSREILSMILMNLLACDGSVTPAWHQGWRFYRISA